MDGVRIEHRQRGHRVRLEWGAEGADLLAGECAAVVIVDVLSFSTAVDIAVGRGARVLPQRWGDPAAALAAASAAGAVPAGPRGGRGPSLRPSSLVGLAPGTLLALPSPNGATLCTRAAAGHAAVFAGCLRNASAVAAAALAAAGDGPIGIVPAGERWPDGTLRVAVEDALGAGAIAATLGELVAAPAAAGGPSHSTRRGPRLAGGGGLSPEVRLAAAQFAAARDAGLPDVLAAVSSGVELIADGFGADVTLAAALDASPCAPRVHAGILSAGD